ncbi:uncharacterized protein ACOB8E_011019 isoform 2-T2 [Sarcophilus harrisii]
MNALFHLLPFPSQPPISHLPFSPRLPAVLWLICHRLEGDSLALAHPPMSRPERSTALLHCPLPSPSSQHCHAAGQSNLYSGRALARTHAHAHTLIAHRHPASLAPRPTIPPFCSKLCLHRATLFQKQTKRGERRASCSSSHPPRHPFLPSDSPMLPRPRGIRADKARFFRTCPLINYHLCDQEQALKHSLLEVSSGDFEPSQLHSTEDCGFKMAYIFNYFAEQEESDQKGKK